MKHINDFSIFVGSVNRIAKNLLVRIIEHDMQTYAKLYYCFYDGNFQKIQEVNMLVSGSDYPLFFKQFQDMVKYPDFEYTWVAGKVGVTIIGNSQNINPSVIRF